MYKNVLDLISENDAFINNFKSIITDLSNDDLLDLLYQEDVIKIIVNNNLFFSNLDIISKKIKSEDITSLIENISKYNKGYVINNKYKLFNYYFSYNFYKKYINYGLDNLDMSIQDIINYIKNYKIIIKSNELISYLISNGYKDVLINNIDVFINQSVMLMDLKKKLSFINKKENIQIINEINKRMDNNLDMIVMEIVSSKYDYDYFKEQKILPYITRLIYELCSEENINYHDIKYVTEGDYSVCYRIGNKFFKIGRKRETFHIKNHRRFLQPLRREEVKTLDSNFMFTLEINQAVDMSGITNKDVYEVYKDLRRDGIILADAKTTNIGRLLKDNKIYFDGINYVDKSGTGFLTDADYTLKKGDLVVVDIDQVYDIDEIDYVNTSLNYIPFEERYNKELDSKIRK